MKLSRVGAGYIAVYLTITKIISGVGLRWLRNGSGQEQEGLLGTNAHESVIRSLRATPTLKVPAVPNWKRMTRETNAPRNSDKAAMTLWSRLITCCPSWKRRGSPVSSTQRDVSTSVDQGQISQISAQQKSRNSSTQIGCSAFC